MRIVYSRNWPIGPLLKSAPSQIDIEAFLFKKGSPRFFLNNFVSLGLILIFLFELHSTKV